MTRYGMVIRIDRCIGCYNCLIACKDEYVGNDYLPFSIAQPDTGQFWMAIKERERGQYPHAVKVAYTPTPCMHCKDAPCIKAAKDGAAYETEDGIVVFDPVKSKGQKQIMESCPYGVVFWNEKLDVPQKCTFCAHRVEKGMQPRCVESCPTDALIFGDLGEPNNTISKLASEGKLEPPRSELGIDTAVRYIGSPGTLIAGSVIFGDTDECSSGVKVIIADDSTSNFGTMHTNSFGDFEFDNLRGGKTYTLKFEHPGYAPHTLIVKLEWDTYLGNITLRKQMP